MVWNLYNKNKRKQAAATWTTACDGVCGGISARLVWWLGATIMALVSGHICSTPPVPWVRRLPRAPAHVSSPTFHPPTLTHTK